MSVPSAEAAAPARRKYRDQFPDQFAAEGTDGGKVLSQPRIGNGDPSGLPVDVKRFIVTLAGAIERVKLIACFL